MAAFAKLMIICLATLPANPQASEVNRLLVELTVPTTTESAADRMVVLGRADARVAVRLDRELPGMLNSAKDVLVVQNEARVAGAVRSQSSIPALVALLGKPNQTNEPFFMTPYLELQDDPVGRALFDIGAAAVQPLAVPLGSESRTTRKRAMRILLKMNDAASRSLLEGHLPHEADPDLRNYLRANHVGAQTSP